MLTADRATIEQSPAPEALAWMRPEDLFFLQIQGSGTLVFENGRRATARYAADNGRPFVAIARPMAELGLLPRNRTGGEDIRRWLADHAGPEADAVMRRNTRYIFFALQADDGRDPAGASGVSLPPGRSLAIDPSRHGYGELWWIDADAPILTGAAKRYRRLAMALDTGSAIRGEVRADLYTGRGDEAGREAGRVRHTLRMTRLTPSPSPASADAPCAGRCVRRRRGCGRWSPPPSAAARRSGPSRYLGRARSADAEPCAAADHRRLSRPAAADGGVAEGARQRRGGRPADTAPAARPHVPDPGPIEPNRRVAASPAPASRSAAAWTCTATTRTAPRAALHAFVLRAQADGARAVLVITGEGRVGDGVLRQRMPEWLAEPPVRAAVAGVSSAEARQWGGRSAVRGAEAAA